jgi:hypothetical protein
MNTCKCICAYESHAPWHTVFNRYQFHLHFTHAFLYKSKFWSFSLIYYGFVIFGAKISYKKRARKMLVKLMGARITRALFLTLFTMFGILSEVYNKSVTTFMRLLIHVTDVTLELKFVIQTSVVFVAGFLCWDCHKYFSFKFLISS